CMLVVRKQLFSTVFPGPANGLAKLVVLKQFTRSIRSLPLSGSAGPVVRDAVYLPHGIDHCNGAAELIDLNIERVLLVRRSRCHDMPAVVGRFHPERTHDGTVFRFSTRAAPSASC